RYWQMISQAARLAAGCFVFCTAEGFRQAGGFDEKVYASEEIWFSLRLRAWAHKNGQVFRIINRSLLRTSSRKDQNVLQMLLTIMVISIFPAAVRFRSLCFLWYACRHSEKTQR
ncbi:MAG: glycosyl transferase family 2, partial [Candidatus Riflebacteria bacterium]|nr:glycosyl transferase family 2 [Candidatus Riflebacteria bacterium]